MEPYLPELQKRKQRRNRHIKRYLLLGAFLFVMIGFIFLVRNTSLFQVKKMTVEGVDESKAFRLIADVRAQMMRGWLSRWLGGENYLAWSSTITFSPWEYRTLSLTKEVFARKVVIHAEEREPFGIWCHGARSCAWFDNADGMILLKTLAPEGALVLRIDEEKESELSIGDLILPREKFLVLHALIDFFHAKLIQFNSAVFRRDLDELTITDTLGRKFIFSLRFDPEKNLGALEKVLSDRSNIEYIDLTVPQKIYIKRRVAS